MPSADQSNDSYYGLPANQISQYYSLLHLSPALSGTPIPTDHWWTDLLIANRSYLPSGTNQYVIQQDPYGGNMWVIPSRVNPESYGLELYYANSWQAANGNGSPQGAINPGTPLPIHGDIPYHIPAADILIADFENGYPAGSTRTGTGFAATPSTGSGLTGMMGSYCASTRDAGDPATGTLALPSFTVQKHYLNFLICGGNTAATAVQLVVNGNVVLTASGSNTTAFQWVTWDISPWAGQTATVQIVDTSTGSWGFIACDQIVESDSNQPSGRYGGDLVATNTTVTNWGDWNVDFKLPDSYGDEVDVTMARGIPFTWTTWTGMNPKIILGASTTFYDTNNNAITPASGTFTASAMSFNFNGKWYGVFLPDNTTCAIGGSGGTTYMEPQLSGSNNYMVVGYLPAQANLAEFNNVAFARPTNTQISWSLDQQHGRVITNWNISTTPLKGTNQNTIQGWLPHHYRTTTTNFSFSSYTYQTQRGIMKCATGNSFQIDFPFNGIAPVLPAPVSTGTVNDYQPARMSSYMANFNPGTMLGETYGSGKALGLCAQYMTQAYQMGDTTDFNRLESALRTALENWYTYTPGETQGFFATYSNWHALIGFDVSYGSQAFNDLHFHYGYFTVAGALLGMYDKQYLANYGPMMKQVVKTFANYDRTDTSEPFLRMFDVWEGHSNAGGMSSPNGENQESSSEAMNSWAGVYLLGSMMNDSDMTSAGAMGFAMESAAVNEYWEDLYNSNFPGVYGRAWAGQVWGDSIVYGNYFTADPVWDYAIQMVPSNHWNNYLVRNQTATATAKLQAMWTERDNWAASYPAWSGTAAYANGTWVNYNSSVYYSGTAIAANAAAPASNNQWVYVANASESTPDILTGYPGDYVLAYQALWDHDNAAAMFDNYYTAKEDIATNTSWAGSTYYLIHAMRLVGNQDANYTTSIPTSAVYYNSTTGVRTYVVYNPQATTQAVSVYNNGSIVGTMTIPGYTGISTTNANYTAPAPGAPSGVAASAAISQITLNWNPVAGASSYNIKRATSSGGPYTTIGSSSTTTYTDSGAMPGTVYYYVITAVNSIGESVYSTQVNSYSLPPPAFAVDCGSTSAAGQFITDTDYSGGTASSVTAVINTSNVTSPAPQAVYQTYRFGNCTYTIGGLAPGANYLVRLHFAETYWSAANSRLFNVSINGTQVLSSFDVYNTSGGKDVATIQQFTKAANGSGQFVIQFSNVKDNALICGIEIRVPPPVVTTLLGSQTVNAGQAVTFSVSATGSGSLSYQWYKNGAAISGATSTSYTIANPSSTDAASYTVDVVDSAGDLTSQTYNLTVNPSVPAVPAWAFATMAGLLLIVAARRFRVYR
ncbi:MAG TPA: glycosyl hydrolase [Chthoniobacteraceae bacterium]|nr:glycosyl hydrolase [Chthoniobacteraceae bacterium]